MCAPPKKKKGKYFIEKRKIQKFNRSNASKVVRLVKTSIIQSNHVFDIIKEEEETCSICRKYKNARMKLDIRF